MTREELIELLQDEDVKRAIRRIVRSDSTPVESPLKEDDRRRQAEATGGMGQRRG